MVCILLWSSDVRVHDSQAYQKIGVTRERIRRIWELREILLSFQTEVDIRLSESREKAGHKGIVYGYTEKQLHEKNTPGFELPSKFQRWLNKTLHQYRRHDQHQKPPHQYH